MDHKFFSGPAKGSIVPARRQMVWYHLAPGRLGLAILAFLVVVQLPEILAVMDHFWLVVLKLYLVTVLAHWIHAGMKFPDKGRMGRTLTISALPLLLLLPSYLAVASLLNLDEGQVQLLVSAGLSITYFNLGAVIFSGPRTLDGGRLMADGRRLLGEGKTIRGSAGGLVLAMSAGWVSFTGAAAGLMIGLLTMMGDLIASFVKRRLGLARGHPVMILDQLDSILLLLLLELTFHTFGFEQRSMLALILATFFVQICGNHLLFLIGKKDVPW